MPPLVNLCLGLIAREFERFYVAIQAPCDANLKRNLEFLQRTYSSELASELFRRKKLKDEYLEFVLNKHLKFLNEKWLSSSCSVKDVFCRLPNLTKVTLFQDSDEVLENIAKFCPKISEIDTYFMTDQGVKNLCASDNGKCPCLELKNISVRSMDFRLTDDGLELILRNVKSLESLHFRQVALILYFIYQEYLPDFEKMPKCNLVELDISEDESLPYYNDIFRIALTVCPRLKYLSCSVSEKEQLEYFSNTCLEELMLSFRKSSQRINIDSFLKNCCRNLVTFRVYNCLMSVSGIANCCPNLRSLILDDVTFVEDHGDARAVFQSLVNCTFSQTKDKSISDGAISLFLLSSPKLQDVKFIHRDLSPEIKTSILKCIEKCLLKSISFMVCRFLEKDFVKVILVNCKSLKKLEIWDCPFPEQKNLIQFAKTLPNKPHIILFDK